MLKNIQKRGLFLSLGVGSVLVGCDWFKNEQKLTCDVPQYAYASVASEVPRDIPVMFCSDTVSLPAKVRIVKARSSSTQYRTAYGIRRQEVTAPYSDSHGDGCAKMVGVGGENVVLQRPFLSGSDQATVKICLNRERYVLLDRTAGCPDGFTEEPRDQMCLKGFKP